MSSYLECSDLDLLFDMVRGVKGVDMDWVKSQVYGVKTVPETFPSDLPTCKSIIERVIPGTLLQSFQSEEDSYLSSQW